jgi:hypothetical protein
MEFAMYGIPYMEYGIFHMQKKEKMQKGRVLG